MKVRTLSQAVVAGLAVFVIACNTSNPNRPTMTFASPTAQSPANGTIYNFNQQPITLTIVNVPRTGNAAVTYSLEVAATSAFTTKAFSRDNIAEGGSGTTAVTLSPLDGNTTYYWRYKANVDGVTGEPSAVQSFFVRPNIVLSAPALVEPTNNTEVFAAKPTFTVNNAAFTGPAGTLFYEFQVSNSASFGSLIATATVQQQSTRTSWTPTNDLPEGPTFWRVRVSDPAAGVTSAFSSTSQFTRKFGIDLNSVTYILGPNIASWPETRKITAEHFGDQLCVFPQGEDWPAVPFPFDASVAVEGNQFMFVNVGGKWYGASGHWYRPGQNCKGEVDEAFFIEGFLGVQPISSVVLHPGDVFGVAQTTPSRAWPGTKSLDHRSNVVLVVW